MKKSFVLPQLNPLSARNSYDFDNLLDSLFLHGVQYGFA